MNIERLSTWTREAESGLAETLGGFEKEFEQQVEKGISQLWLIDGSTWLITRVEYPVGKNSELVVCCMKGNGLNSIAPAIIAQAKAQGIGSIRVHSKRLGMGRVLSAFGFREAEKVYRLELGANHHG